ncbi:hypothetical protein B0T09DRAFT_170663 [Sordaria sp. MPI-SDFR-AT-0083]|nr:hypothetical protein B0T09DRAFT_170663 [Sordaria sp. MPI-SDFR-AT-0083]
MFLLASSGCRLMLFLLLDAVVCLFFSVVSFVAPDLIYTHYTLHTLHTHYTLHTTHYYSLLMYSLWNDGMISFSLFLFFSCHALLLLLLLSIFT